MVFEFSIGSVECIFYLQFWDSERGNALWILHYGSNCLMLETVFEFVFSKMTSAKFKPCNEFKPSDILRAGSKLFQSMAVGGKSQFFKKMKFVLIRGVLSMFLVKYWCLFLRVKLKIYWKCLIYDILKIFSVPMSNLEWLQT